jgi:hypothetical protein
MVLEAAKDNPCHIGKKAGFQAFNKQLYSDHQLRVMRAGYYQASIVSNRGFMGHLPC